MGKLIDAMIRYLDARSKKRNCLHDFKLVKEVDVRDELTSNPITIHQTYVCNKCGEFKKIGL